MTQEEQYAILGRTMTQYKETRNKLGALDSLNKQIAKSARELASALDHYPDRIHVAKSVEGSMARAGAQYVYSAEDSAQLDPEFLRTHLAEYTSVKAQKEELRQQLIAQGADDPEK